MEFIELNVEKCKISNVYYCSYNLDCEYNYLINVPNFTTYSEKKEFCYNKIENAFFTPVLRDKDRILCLIFYLKKEDVKDISLSFSLSSERIKIWLNKELIENSNKWNIIKHITLFDEINEFVIELYNDDVDNYDIFIEKIKSFSIQKSLCSYFIADYYENKIICNTLSQQYFKDNYHLEYKFSCKDHIYSITGKPNSLQFFKTNNYEGLIICEAQIFYKNNLVYKFIEKHIFPYKNNIYKKLSYDLLNIKLNLIKDIKLLINSLNSEKIEIILMDKIINYYREGLLNYRKLSPKIYDFYLINTICFYSKYDLGLFIFYYSTPQKNEKKYPVIVILSSSMTSTYLEHYREKYGESHIIIECSGLGSGAGNSICKKVIFEILEIMYKNFNVENNNIYVVGYSSNATTALSIVAENQKDFAGCLCIGGIGNIKYEILYTNVMLLYAEYDTKSILNYINKIDGNSKMEIIKVSNINHNLLQQYVLDFVYLDKLLSKKIEKLGLKEYKWFNNPLILPIKKIYEIKYFDKINYGAIKKFENRVEFTNINKFIYRDKIFKYDILLSNNNMTINKDQMNKLRSFKLNNKFVNRKIYYIFDNKFHVVYVNDKYYNTAQAMSKMRTLNEKNIIKCNIKTIKKNKINIFKKISYILIGSTQKIVFKYSDVKIYDNGIFYNGEFHHGNYVICQIVRHPIYQSENILLINSNNFELLQKCFFTRNIFVPCSYSNDNIYNCKAIIYMNKKYEYLK